MLAKEENGCYCAVEGNEFCYALVLLLGLFYSKCYHHTLDLEERERVLLEGRPQRIRCKLDFCRGKGRL